MKRSSLSGKHFVGGVCFIKHVLGTIETMRLKSYTSADMFVIVCCQTCHVGKSKWFPGPHNVDLTTFYCIHKLTALLTFG